MGARLSVRLFRSRVSLPELLFPTMRICSVFADASRLGKTILEADNITVGVPRSEADGGPSAPWRVLTNTFELRLCPGDRILTPAQLHGQGLTVLGYVFGGSEADYQPLYRWVTDPTVGS